MAPMTSPIDPDLLASVVRAELAPLIGQLERFVDRRLSELSAEIYSATQLAECSEDNITTQLRQLHAQVESMVAPPDAQTPTSGMELEAVVQTTEAAANQIMEAAEGIAETVRTALPAGEAAAEIGRRIDAIFEACAFQDLTGQRVRRAIDHLQHVESALTGMMMPAGTAHEVHAVRAPTVRSTGADIDQAAVDALFG